VEVQGSGLVSLLADAKADYSDFEGAVASNWAKKYDLLWSLWTQHCDWKVGTYIHRAELGRQSDGTCVGLSKDVGVLYVL
jgi:hypothetical protein